MVRNNVIKRVGVSQLRWFGHVERMASERLVKRIYLGEVEGFRLRGRPVCKWMDVVDRVLKEREFPSMKRRRACMNAIMSVAEAKEVCLDRNVWRRMIVS